jgi:hypothetical protein
MLLLKNLEREKIDDSSSSFSKSTFEIRDIDDVD